MSKRKAIVNIMVGFFLLLGLHIVAAILILGIGTIIGSNQSAYRLSRNIIIYGIYGFFLWQLIYVIPLCSWLKNQGKIDVRKGVIIGAIMTFLVYVGCILLFLGAILFIKKT